MKSEEEDECMMKSGSQSSVFCRSLFSYTNIRFPAVLVSEWLLV